MSIKNIAVVVSIHHAHRYIHQVIALAVLLHHFVQYINNS